MAKRPFRQPNPKDQFLGEICETGTIFLLIFCHILSYILIFSTLYKCLRKFAQIMTILTKLVNEISMKIATLWHWKKERLLTRISWSFKPLWWYIQSFIPNFVNKPNSLKGLYRVNEITIFRIQKIMPIICAAVGALEMEEEENATLQPACWAPTYDKLSSSN